MNAYLLEKKNKKKKKVKERNYDNTEIAISDAITIIKSLISNTLKYI